MKKIKYIGVIVSMILMISYSCNKEELIKNEIKYEKASYKEIQQYYKKLNYNFETKKDYYDLKESFKTEIGNTFDSWSNIYDAFAESRNFEDLDVSPINLYLQMRNQEPINTKSYMKEGFQLIKSSKCDFDQFSLFLKKYNMYSSEQLDIIKKFHQKALFISSNIEFQKELKKLESYIYESNLPIFERNTLLIYTVLAQFYNPELMSNLTINKTNLTCVQCQKKYGWAIYGIAILFAAAAIIISYFSLGLAIPFIIAIGVSFFGAIWLILVRGFCPMCL